MAPRLPVRVGLRHFPERLGRERRRAVAALQLVERGAPARVDRAREVRAVHAHGDDDEGHAHEVDEGRRAQEPVPVVGDVAARLEALYLELLAEQETGR